MSDPKSLVEHVTFLLRGKGAHASPEAALDRWPEDLRGRRPPGAEHSGWELLEHLRIAQLDILEYSRDARHVSPEWPAGYWPSSSAPPDAAAWEKSRAAFFADLSAMQELVAERAEKLLDRLPHAEAPHTLLREALLLADHNAYHLGQLVALRRRLGAWPVSEEDGG